MEIINDVTNIKYNIAENTNNLKQTIENCYEHLRETEYSDEDSLAILYIITHYYEEYFV